MTPARRHNLARLLAPRHIAFVGGRDAAVAMGEARRIGYTGAIWPVNPGRATLAGLPCYPTIADLPQAPDATFLAVPAAAAVAVTRALADRGAGGIVCYTAGFAEAGEPEREAALIQAAGDMALIGPNCYGLINYPGRVALWPFAHGGSTPGHGAAICTQSGMLSSDITMAQRSLPLAYMISAGNQAVLGFEHFIDHLCQDPTVRAIGLHIEGLRDIPAFAAAALKSRARGVPIVALKTGASRLGAALTVSHTGSLAGADALYDALFDRVGIQRVTSPAELLETLKFLCVAGVPRGGRLMGFTCSGGGATMLADGAERQGLDFPGFAAAQTAHLAALLPDIATVSNPLDYTTPIWGQAERTGPVFAAALAATRADAAILVQDYPAPGLDESKPFYAADAAAFAAAARGIPAAICATLPENLDTATREGLVAIGVAPLQGLPEALVALRAAIAWGAHRRRPDPAPLAPPTPPGAPRLVDEAKAKARLTAWGLPVPPGIVTDPPGAASAAATLGYPVALKLLGVPHKSDVGAVALALADAPALAAALAAMQTAVARNAPEAPRDRLLVERMAPRPVAELLVGLRRDRQFGATLTLGSGGVLVALLADSTTLLLPATRDDLARALAGLRVTRLIAGHRGSPPGDLGALLDTLGRLCSLFCDTPDLQELEINPLFVCPTGVWLVDALMVETAR